MTLNMILYVALVVYVLIITLGFIFKENLFFMIAGLLWFIPIIEVDNIFIKVVSISMILMHGLMFILSKKGQDFE